MDLNELTMQPLAPLHTQQPGSGYFAPKGVCSKAIRFRVEAGILHDVVFQGGCDGNLKGIGMLVEGMPVAEVVERLGGINCGSRPTSCPDQLAQALLPYLED
ncbi:TIGR03905 family TSCPD domain-containing protein [Pseudodesulfovibrio cashew]|uniref:ribonucleoside-diphosphate reductase n=1 Tax=Pseudodesulfovibrio cashew TaxID=2678688 RepID=A0A6I6JC16_9BACT|nr:TIGR03905 family TSCPD domain-containing protein [Pseudodesulfovibrio cashew]QGY40316.1 TIGR03905 family TSCPD domain-containing protein [Pseudodesulfovibrio cashew]